MAFNATFNNISVISWRSVFLVEETGVPLKVSAPFIVSPLTYIFNRIIDSGIYPNISKHAKVSPIFKLGEKCLL